MRALDEQEREIKDARDQLKAKWFLFGDDRKMLEKANALLQEIESNRIQAIVALHESAESEAQLDLRLSGT